MPIRTIGHSRVSPIYVQKTLLLSTSWMFRMETTWQGGQTGKLDWSRYSDSTIEVFLGWLYDRDNYAMHPAMET